MFRRLSPDADSEKLFDLDARTARRLGSILTGTNFETVDVSELEVPLGEAITEWWEVGEGFELAGTALGDAHVRWQTGVSLTHVERSESIDLFAELGVVFLLFSSASSSASGSYWPSPVGSSSPPASTCW